MAKRKVSLSELTEAAVAAERPNNVVTLQRDNVDKRRTGHTSLYLHPNVRRAIQEIAFEYDKRPHALYMEGIDLMLASYGKPTSAELAKK